MKRKLQGVLDVQRQPDARGRTLRADKEAAVILPPAAQMTSLAGPQRPIANIRGAAGAFISHKHPSVCLRWRRLNVC